MIKNSIFTSETNQVQQRGIFFGSSLNAQSNQDQSKLIQASKREDFSQEMKHDEPFKEPLIRSKLNGDSHLHNQSL